MDYYATLGVERSADAAQIKKAYKKLAMKYHPDRAPAGKEKEHEEKFKEVNEAFSVLSDAQKKAQYDRFGSTGQNFNGFDFSDMFNGGASPFDDFIDQVFGFNRRGPRKGQSFSYELEITLEQAATGLEREISFALPGVDRKTLNVKVPPGVHTGTRLRLTGEGAPGMNGGPNGDVYVEIFVKKHKVFTRQNDDLYYTLPITFAQACMGSEIEVPCITGKATLKIPAGTDSGTLFRMKSKGMPHVSGRYAGDQYVKVNITVPKRLTKKQKEALTEFSDDSVTKSFIDRIFGR